LALRSDGIVVAWGFRAQTNVPPGLSNVITLAGARNHSVALRGDGSVVLWASLPTLLAGLTNVVALSGGSSLSLAVVGGPPLAPLATTSPATQVGIGAATLEGTVIPRGLDTFAWFEWGTTLEYGNATPLASVGRAFSEAPFKAMLQGLYPDTTYHYRVVATNAVGLVRGEDMSFATPLMPPPPRISYLSFNGVGPFYFSFSGSAGASYRVWGSTNLIRWTVLGTAMEGSGYFYFRDTEATNFPLRFYRLSWP
jgi:hypothetical protein